MLLAKRKKKVANKDKEPVKASKIEEWCQILSPLQQQTEALSTSLQISNIHRGSKQAPVSLNGVDDGPGGN